MSSCSLDSVRYTSMAREKSRPPTTLVYTRNSEGNTLLRNEGELRFEDVTAAAGVREGGLTLGVTWGD